MMGTDRASRFAGRMAVLAVVGSLVCLGGALLCCFLPRIVEWR